MASDAVVASANILRRRLAEFVAASGYSKPGSIPAEMTFRQWVEELGRRGLKVDGRLFTLADRAALIPLYDAIPSTIEEARRATLVVMKGAQVGMTIWEMLADLYLAIKFEPLTIGMFLPSQDLASDKSERRFLRLLRTIPDLYQRLITLNGKKVGEGNKMTRVMGDSAFLFLWTTGRVSTESRPMDVLSFDEVQEMSLDQIDKTMERMSASLFRYTLMLSTANVPKADIHYWFELGTQETWHTRCPGCSGEHDLSEHFPKCIEFNTGQLTGAPLNEYVYVCPACGGWIEDTQRGRYIAQNPGATIRSFHVAQITSPTITPRDLIEGWNRAVTGDQRKTFYNRKMGRPYIDKDQLPVSMADCLACAEEGAKLGLKWEDAGRETVMGIDQMGGWCAVIIKRRLPDGRQAVVHVAAIFDDDPFKHCDTLMQRYGVSVAVVEQLPNVNDARRFVNRWRGRAFLAGYSSDAKADMIVWGDAVTRSDQRTSAEDRSRYSVVLQQYKAMQTTLFRIRDRTCLFPDPAGIIAEVLERGERKRIALCRDWVFLHYTRTALVVEEDEETRKLKPLVRKIGLDPHYSYASMLCDVAWARNHGAGTFFMPQNDDKPKTEMAQRVAEQMPGLPAHVIQAMDSTPEGTCGRCSSYRDGNCEARGFTVQRLDPGCMVYSAAEVSA